MTTARQTLGTFGEDFVVKACKCQRCQKGHSFVKLPPNFKCADLICSRCKCLAQVKAKTVLNVDAVPNGVMGAAWGPQSELIEAGTFYPLFLVLVSKSQVANAVYYLDADVHTSEMFRARKPLSPGARRAGWVGFNYDLSVSRSDFVRLI